MKRLVAIIALVLVAAIGSYTVLAQQQPQSDPPQRGMMGGGMGGGMMQGGGGMMCRGMMQPGGMGCRGAMCGALMHESVTSTSDGGVVVSVAGKLIKYDSGLNKVKETSLDVDWTKMHQMM